MTNLAGVELGSGSPSGIPRWDGTGSLGWRFGQHSRLDWTAAYEGAQQRSYSEAPLLRGATPFTDRLTDGTQDGHFVGGTYTARADLDGDPQHIYSRIETALPTTRWGLNQELRAGLELRREWSGGPGYQFEDEFAPELRFDAVGKLAMANAGPGTKGGQFFITVSPPPWLNDHPTIFFEVVQGQHVANKISMVTRDRRDKPVEPVAIKQIKIEEVK